MAKVVFCVQQLFELGGTETVTIDLANRLAEKGHDVEVVSFVETKSRPCVYSFSKKVKVTSLGLPFDVLRFDNVAPELLKKGRVFSFIGYGIKLLHHAFWKAPIHRKKLYEKIQDGGTLVGTSLESYRFAPKKGRVIHEFHFGFDEFKKPFFRFLLWGMRKPEKWIFLSESIWKQVIERHPKMAEKSTYIHNPIRLESELHLEPHGNSILFLGRYMPQKNPLLALQTAKVLRSQGFPFHLSIFGAGHLLAEMKNYVKRWDLASCVSIGEPTLDVKAAVSECDLLLLTSEYEGWPLIVGEANALSRPAISSDFGPNAHEMIVDGESGFIVSSKRPEDFAEAIKKALGNSEVLVAMKQKAYERSLLYAEDAILAKWEEIL